MSKCDLRIVFDRTDRRYRGGDEVSGTVSVQVNQDVESKGILLERFWQTHGRGNTASGAKQTSVLFQGNLRAGQSLSYPFRFTAPYGPPTYHGTHLNVDHYVNVRVDVPWAIDPKLKEEYILLPGSRQYDNLPTWRAGRPTARQGLQAAGVPVALAMIVFGVFMLFPFFPCGLVLIPLGLAVLFFALRKSLAERKIGQVAVSWGSLAVSPGDNLPLRLSFTPRRSARLNRVTAKLVGQERCVSGSGTNRTTHTHKLHERTVILVPECDVTAGRPIQVEGVVPIPQTNAFSFSASANALIWELEVRVDIPLWPDWVEKRVVVVRPAVGAEVVEATIVEEPPPAAAGPALPVPFAEEPKGGPLTAATRLDQTGTFAGEDTLASRRGAAADLEAPEPTQGTAEPSLPAEAAEPEAPVEEEAPAAAAPSTDPALIGIVEQIASADRYSSRREEILKEQSEQSFGCAIEIAKIERTYSYIPDQRFRKGRTVTGKLQGTDCEVSVQVAEARNEELDALQPGSLLGAHCTLLKWNTIYDRIEMREA